MEKKTKNLFKIAISLIVLVIIVTFYNIFVLHNYVISFEVPCDPNNQNCFVRECDSSLMEDCSSSPNDYYKFIERKAFKVNICGEGNFECLECKENEIDCNVVVCDPLQEENICSGN